MLCEDFVSVHTNIFLNSEKKIVGDVDGEMIKMKHPRIYRPGTYYSPTVTLQDKYIMNKLTLERITYIQKKIRKICTRTKAELSRVPVGRLPRGVVNEQSIQGLGIVNNIIFLSLSRRG